MFSLVELKKALDGTKKKHLRLPNFRVKRVRVNCVGLYIKSTSTESILGRDRARFSHFLGEDRVFFETDARKISRF